MAMEIGDIVVTQDGTRGVVTRIIEEYEPRRDDDPPGVVGHRLRHYFTEPLDDDKRIERT